MIRKRQRMIPFPGPGDGHIRQMLIEKINAESILPIAYPFLVKKVQVPAAGSISFRQSSFPAELIWPDFPAPSQLASYQTEPEGRLTSYSSRYQFRADEHRH